MIDLLWLPLLRHHFASVRKCLARVSVVDSRLNLRMAPTDQKMKNKNFKEKDFNKNKSKKTFQGVVKKRKWIPENKVFQGSVQEGQGFAFKRKEKFQHDYNKLLRKEEKKKRKLPSKPLYKEEYPEHLKHLYLAEEEKLKNEAWTHRLNRSKMRLKGQKEREEMGGNDDDDDDDTDAAAQQSEPADPDAEVTALSEQTDSAAGNNEATTSSEKESLPVSNRMKKKMQKKTSYQKTKEEFEAVKERRKKKKEEFLQDKQQREEATQRYKQKRMETFQILSKKTKKGQPNLNLQMEYLLQKIQGPGK